MILELLSLEIHSVLYFDPFLYGNLLHAFAPLRARFRFAAAEYSGKFRPKKIKTTFLIMIASNAFL